MRPCVCCNLEESARSLINISGMANLVRLSRVNSASGKYRQCNRATRPQPCAQSQRRRSGRSDRIPRDRHPSGEIARSATLTGDLRGAIDALGRQAAAAESYTRIAEAKQEGASEAELVWTADGHLNPNALQSSMTIADFDETSGARLRPKRNPNRRPDKTPDSPF